jgi:hypothetical protein
MFLIKLHNNNNITFQAQKKRKSRRKVSKRNKERLYKNSHKYTRKNKWFHDHRKLWKEIDEKDEMIEKLKR